MQGLQVRTKIVRCVEPQAGEQSEEKVDPAEARIRDRLLVDRRSLAQQVGRKLVVVGKLPTTNGHPLLARLLQLLETELSGKNQAVQLVEQQILLL